MLKLSFHGGQPGSLTDLKKKPTKKIHDHSKTIQAKFAFKQFNGF